MSMPATTSCPPPSSPSPPSACSPSAPTRPAKRSNCWQPAAASSPHPNRRSRTPPPSFLPHRMPSRMRTTPGTSSSSRAQRSSRPPPLRLAPGERPPSRRSRSACSARSASKPAAPRSTPASAPKPENYWHSCSSTPTVSPPSSPSRPSGPTPHHPAAQNDSTLATAASPTDPSALAAALSRAVNAYNGSFAEGERLEWVEAPREDLRRRAINAATRLAEFHQQAGHLDPALATLEQAVTWDPQAEELYRRIMRLQTALHRPDAVQRTYDQLTARLDDLDAEPDDTTRQLLNELLGSGSHSS